MEVKKTTSGKRKSGIRWLLRIIVLILVVLFIHRQNTTVGMTHYEVVSDKIPKGFDLFRIVQISDLHDAEFGDNHIELVNKVKMATPGAIFITGDFIDSNRYNLKKSLRLIEEIQFVAPIYYVTGNHEIATGDSKHIKDRLEKLGVIVLSNEAHIIKSFPGSDIAIGGIEDPLSSSLEDDEVVEASIIQTFKNVPDDMFKILLSHRPESFDIYTAHGVDVTFSGHAHGGQFRIPGIGGLVSPGQGWFPKYTSGIHEKHGNRMVVSRGLGNSIVPIRLFNQPEIIVVTLRKKN
ncbi:metallophosphoesterase [Sporosarcina limicola]|uniref:MPP superfamily phosphohydrolase n=1 Tax=Sporosarcina limicola TaxID=34101 RepID=A0A927REA9_9BACL|nr:metallophosphoesterase [Sporosarcina limicola]MBE1554432.1 putative MPP superfamily phosphohydrolase [Sporosarcina limicola]